MWASSQERRIVIAFFPEASGVASIARKLRKLKAKVSYYPANTQPSASGPYSHLRLAGESLIFCRALIQNLSQTIQTLQAGGARSIFLTAGSKPKTRAVPRPKVSDAVEVGLGELQKTLDRFKAEMDAARDYLVESVRLGHPASPAAQWVIDNAYLIKLNLTEIRKELRDAYRSQRTNLGRLVNLAEGLVDLTGGRISEDPMVRFLTLSLIHI